MIGVLCYKGGGNLGSVFKAITYLGYQFEEIWDQESLKKADALIFPGQGSFAQASRSLKEANLWEALREFIYSGKPFFGICLGLQMLFDYSDEFGFTEGLKVISGKVVEFQKDFIRPHLGWNKVFNTSDLRFFKDIPDDSSFYFVHSYYPEVYDLSCKKGFAEYVNKRFVCVVEKDNVFACQFHPEKSGRWGLKLLDNFLSSI
ncbi:Imidazole glycerol phosphate synthase subunit hisH [Thermodesulfobium narugense DSM 14796]|uniref:Imidazole glycerol phosphate synthase subunit HisH n=1 Tax=Thermodesulfobium narugense DSM 14796 TaxID=747365 RepID=M1E6Z8_9BACT|nr:imidazole glycerol phosphate synthase subunit HisH [Thermodesulfobium narugense]AEE14255.1 Imidazole glycerol phosphate synthase subunit hisH [Thermodesulfobium narugense DSM 14796]